MENCKGNGECLIEDDYGNYITNECIHNCKPIQCKNFEICGAKFPEMYIGCWGGKGCCMNCDIIFGKWQGGTGILKMSENKEECCICLENKKLVSLPKCNHNVCIECLKKLYFYEEEQYDSDDNLIHPENEPSNKCPLCRK